MTKIVLTQKPDSIYDDLPEERYHFPGTYLNQIKKAINDWVIYYRPRRGRKSSFGQPASTYFAVAKLLDIVADSDDTGLYYALVSEYLEFDEPVSFRRDEASYEAGLLKSDGTVNKGAFGRSVRMLSDEAFNSILAAGFAAGPRAWESAAERAQSLYPDRPLVDSIRSRHFRDRRFRLAVCDAYNNTCAFTGLSLINGGGRPEVQAAHIQPVKDRGPDSVRNGLALSGTAHWMFDRGLVTLDENLRILPSSKLDASMHQGLITPGKEILLPEKVDCRPSQYFLDYHRNQIFHE